MTTCKATDSYIGEPLSWYISVQASPAHRSIIMPLHPSACHFPQFKILLETAYTRLQRFHRNEPPSTTQRNGNRQDTAARRRFQNPFPPSSPQRYTCCTVPAIIATTKVLTVLEPPEDVRYMTVSNSTLSIGAEYITAVLSLKSHGRNKKNVSPSVFLKKFAKDGMAQAGENVAERMEQSATIGSLNIAVGMDKSSKNFCETGNDHLDCIKSAFGAWCINQIFDSENKWPCLYPSHCWHSILSWLSK